jgi:hypothetical protein
MVNEIIVQTVSACSALNDGIPSFIDIVEKGWKRMWVEAELIGLLNWLRDQGRDREYKKYILGIELPPSAIPTLSQLINETALSSLFLGDEAGIDFQDFVPQEEREQICRYVAQNFREVAHLYFR